MNNYDEKIISIKETQKELLEMIKGKINEEGRIFNLDTLNIVDVLARDNIVVKKYEAIVEARKLIAYYTEKIEESKDIEEIKELRKKLNSCISKIKREMKNRGLDEIEINNYMEEAKKLRKKIAINVRFLKREEKIKEIEELNSNFDNLNEEELLRLKKLVKNEVSYGKRNLITGGEPKPKKAIVAEEQKQINPLNITFSSNPSANQIKSYATLEEFLKEKIVEYEDHYHIKPIAEYDGSVIKKIRLFTENLPNILKNKDSVDRMRYENSLYIRKPELKAYSEYIGSKSSVLKNLKNVIKPSVLEAKENECVDEHQRIIAWIIEYCETNHLHISFNQKTA